MREFMRPENQKRESGRVRLNERGKYRLLPEGEWYPCQILDLSPKGVALEGRFSFYVDDMVELVFELRGEIQRFEIRVTNLSGRKAGGEFTQVSEEKEEFLKSFIATSLMDSQ